MKNKDFMTVGEIAKQLQVSVRTLQYYDKEGLLKPSGQSEGGRRLYTNKDMVKMHQILSMKYLGFSLEEIKNNLFDLDTPEEVLSVLNKQAQGIEAQISNMTEALSIIKALKQEVSQMQTVDFEKYAQMVMLLRQANESYWIVKVFDEDLMNHAQAKYGESAVESSLSLYDEWQQLCDEAVKLQTAGKLPDCSEAQIVAKKWWDMVMSFTGGDMSLLPKLMAFNEDKSQWDETARKKQEQIDDFIGKALEVYFTLQGAPAF